MTSASLALIVMVCVAAPVAFAFESILGYTPVSDVSSTLEMGTAIEAVNAAMGAEPRDWTAAAFEYEKTHAGGLSLRSVLPSAGDHRELLAAFTTYHSSQDYVHDFVSAALAGSGNAAGLSEKIREELTMKGIVLQGLLMASMTSLQDAVSACDQGKTEDTGAAHEVDTAWAFYACSEKTGPIKLAEKRAPQFAVENSQHSDAGVSKVNFKLLDHFLTLQQDARDGHCIHMKASVPKIIALMQVPIIQGMLREAFEVDPKMIEETRGADGFVEVAEGWAFARAVLPAIASCSEDAAKKINKNMDTLTLGPEGPHLTDGHSAVQAAVESAYICLGISCTDVNAMVSPWKADHLLWEPCDDAKLLAAAAPVQQVQVETEVNGAQHKEKLHLLLTAAMLVLSLKF